MIVVIGWFKLSKKEALTRLWVQNAESNVIMQVLFPDAVVVQPIVLVPHINEFEGKLTLYGPMSPIDDKWFSTLEIGAGSQEAWSLMLQLG